MLGIYYEVGTVGSITINTKQKGDLILSPHFWSIF
jgi:hypothetical protein